MTDDEEKQVIHLIRVELQTPKRRAWIYWIVIIAILVNAGTVALIGEWLVSR